jgi:hypothetical protein
VLLVDCSEPRTTPSGPSSFRQRSALFLFLSLSPLSREFLNVLFFRPECIERSIDTSQPNHQELGGVLSSFFPINKSKALIKVTLTPS